MCAAAKHKERKGEKNMICVNKVTVSPGSVTLKEGNWYYGASASVSPSNATCGNVRWYSSNSSVATVNSSNGYIYANGVGTTRVYAQATDGSGAEDYLTVTVEANTVCVTSVTVEPRTMEAGDTCYFTASVSPENATNKSVVWSSSNPSVVTIIAESGYAIAEGGGTALITATAADGGGASGSCYVTVHENVLVSDVTLSQTSLSLEKGDTATLSATVSPTNATNKALTWSSSNSSVASVSGGTVTAVSGGSATIMATATDGSGVSGSC